MTCYFADAMEEVDRVAEDKGLKESLGRYAIESGAIMEQVSVSYTHLDVYKRQAEGIWNGTAQARQHCSLES